MWLCLRKKNMLWILKHIKNRSTSLLKQIFCPDCMDKSLHMCKSRQLFRPMQVKKKSSRGDCIEKLEWIKPSVGNFKYSVLRWVIIKFLSDFFLQKKKGLEKIIAFLEPTLIGHILIIVQHTINASHILLVMKLRIKGYKWCTWGYVHCRRWN